MNRFDFGEPNQSSSSTFSFEKTINELPNIDPIICEYCDNKIDMKSLKCFVCNTSIYEMPSRKIFQRKEVPNSVPFTSKPQWNCSTIKFDKQSLSNPFNKLFSHDDRWKCHNCQHLNPNTQTFCKNCTCKKLLSPDDGWKCHKCQHVNPKTSLFCKNCNDKKRYSQSRDYVKSKRMKLDPNQNNPVILPQTEANIPSSNPRQDQWSCGQCGMLNKKSLFNCEICYTVKQNYQMSLK